MEKHNVSWAKIIIFTMTFTFVLAALIVVPMLLQKVNTDSRSGASSARPVINVYALGDSITFGHKDCKSSPCTFEKNTYLSNYSAGLASGATATFHNYALSGTKAFGNTLINSATVFKNGYIQKAVVAPNNQSALESESNLTQNNNQGQYLLNTGYFSAIKGGKVFLAYGRNDVNNANETIDDFKTAEADLVKTLNSQENTVTIITIPPMSPQAWADYVPSSKRTRAFDVSIKSQVYPVELDAFYASKQWEVAYETNSTIVPLSEYFANNYKSDYFSNDGIHPSTTGHKLISDLIASTSSKVERTDLSSQSNGSIITLSATAQGYGQIVYKTGTTFVYSQPFQVAPNMPYTLEKITNNAYVYSTVPVTAAKQTQVKLWNRQDSYTTSDKLSFVVSGVSAVKGLKLYAVKNDASIFCKTKPNPWFEIKGSLVLGNYFNVALENKSYFTPGEYIVAMVYTDMSNKAVSGNPGGNCGTTITPNPNGFVKIKIN